MSQSALRKAEVLPPWQGAAEDFPAYKPWPAPPQSYREKRRLPIDTIVIHATAGGSSAGAMSVTAHGTASWHVLVPDEDEAGHGKFVYRVVPDSGAAWHVLNTVQHPADGKIHINDRSFGIEVVNWQDGRDQFSDWQLRVTAQWVRYCWSHFTGVKYLYTHAYLDPKRKSDPGGLFDWDTFMQYVLEGLPAVQPAPHDPPLIVGPDQADLGEGLMLKGTLYGPVRKIAQALGGDVKWVPSQGKGYLLSQPEDEG